MYVYVYVVHLESINCAMYNLCIIKVILKIPI